MTILVNSGRVAIAQMLIARPVFIGLGFGDAAWQDAAVSPTQDTAALLNPVAYRRATRKLFVLEDDDGAIILPSQKRYRFSDEPTRQLYFNFIFDYGEGVGGYIRELGVFINTVVADGVPAEQQYFEPSQIVSPGDLLAVEYPEDPDKFNPQKRGSYELVVTI